MRWIFVGHIRKLTTFLSVCLIFLMTGCSDLTEVDNINIVVALGIDETQQGQVRVTAEIAHLAAGSTGQQGQSPSDNLGESIVRESVGSTVEDAISQFESMIPHHLYLANNSVFVFGEAYAKRGVSRVIDYLERDRHYRRNQLFVVTSGTAEDVLKANPEPMPYRTQAIRKLVQQSTREHKSVDSEQLRFVRDSLSPPKTAVMARIDETTDNRLTNSGVGLFDHGKLVGFLNPHETEFMSLLLGQRGTLTISVACPKGAQSDVGMTFRTINSDVRIVPTFSGNQVHLFVQVRGNAEVQRLCPNQKIGPGEFKTLEGVLNKAVEDGCQEVMDNLKTRQIDAIKVGNLVYRKHPSLWRNVAENWQNDAFAHIEETFDVQFNLLRSGLASNSPLDIFDSKSMTPQDGYKERIQ